ncbi:MAG: hypothetical protein ACYC64_06880 [Armatimonadota bacterium]
MNNPQCRYDPRSCQSLLGYGRAAHARSSGACIYCGLGKNKIDFDTWRQLSVDHIVPAMLFPGEGKTLRLLFPNLQKTELRALAEKINGINLVTACNFCNSMTSRMKDLSADGILSPEGYENVTSLNAESVQSMLYRLQQRVDELLPTKKDYVKSRLAELRKTFEKEIKPELQNARDRREAKNGVLDIIDVFRERLLNCRSILPRLDKSLVGHWAYPSPQFYEDYGYNTFTVLSEPLTQDAIDQRNALGHFINQSYLVFLYSVLDYHGVLGSIEQNLPGWKDVDVLRRLRNVIGHRVGHYDNNCKDHLDLYKKLQEHYKVDPGGQPENAQAFPLPIDQVLLPMTDGCRRYAAGVLDASR